MARTIAGQLKIPQPQEGEMYLGQNIVPLASPQLGPLMYKFFGPTLEAAIKKGWGPEACGKVAALGLGKTSTGRMTLTGVHHTDRWLDGDVSGEDLLVRIAATTIMAVIIDNLRADDRKNPIRRGKAEPPRSGSVEYPPGTSTSTAGLDYYDGRRERGTDGRLVPHQGQFGRYTYD